MKKVIVTSKCNYVATILTMYNVLLLMCIIFYYINIADTLMDFLFPLFIMLVPVVFNIYYIILGRMYNSGLKNGVKEYGIVEEKAILSSKYGLKYRLIVSYMDESNKSITTSILCNREQFKCLDVGAKVNVYLYKNLGVFNENELL